MTQLSFLTMRPTPALVDKSQRLDLIQPARAALGPGIRIPGIRISLRVHISRHALRSPCLRSFSRDVRAWHPTRGFRHLLNKSFCLCVQKSSKSLAVHVHDTS